MGCHLRFKCCISWETDLWPGAIQPIATSNTSNSIIGFERLITHWNTCRKWWCTEWYRQQANICPLFTFCESHIIRTNTNSVFTYVFFISVKSAVRSHNWKNAQCCLPLSLCAHVLALFKSLFWSDTGLIWSWASVKSVLQPSLCVGLQLCSQNNDWHDKTNGPEDVCPPSTAKAIRKMVSDLHTGCASEGSTG